MKLVKLGLLSIITAGTLFAGTYNVDPNHSNAGFKVKHLMISNISGKFDKFNGSFEYNEITKKVTSLRGVITVSSLNTQNEKRDGDLKSANFFDAIKYPEITFKLNKVKDDYAYGVLTIRGVSKDVKLELENNGSIIDPWGNTRVGLALTGKINRVDYGLKYNAALEAGGVMIGEKVKLDIEIEGILAK